MHRNEKKLDRDRNAHDMKVTGWLFRLGFVAIALMVIFQGLLVLGSVPTESMEPTMPTGTRIIGNRLAYMKNEPACGDIIMFENPDGSGEGYVKRIIGCPGDIVQITEDSVYVNGEKLEETYLNEDMHSDVCERVVVPKEAYYVLGDNRNNSYDSRYWDKKYVSRTEIIGKAVLVLNPFCILE